MNAPIRSSHAESGFSLIELLIAVLIAIEILVAAAIAFDVHNRAAVVQTQVTDLQQSLRVAQYDMARLLRMAGRGGLPKDQRPAAVFVPAAPVPELAGLALEIRNNVTDATDRHIARGDNSSPQALEGTDILTVRGCFSGSVYQLQANVFVPVDTDVPPDDLGDGTVSFTIENVSTANISQPLAPLIEQLNVANARSTMIFLSPVSRRTYGVGRVTQFSPTSGNPTQLQVTVDIDPDDRSSSLNQEIPRPAPYSDLKRGMPATMSAALACLLEEYRYYVQEVHEVPGDTTTPLRPRLTRARFEPGTELPYANDPASFALDLADGVFDLQVALGFDSDFPATDPNTVGALDDDPDFDGVDDTIFEAALGTNDRDTDDWLYNDPGDDPTDGEWRLHDHITQPGKAVKLTWVRVTTLARTQRGDPSYQAPDFDATPGTDLVEDHDYDQAPASQFKSLDNRKFRRRALTTIVDMRND